MVFRSGDGEGEEGLVFKMISTLTQTIVYCAVEESLEEHTGLYYEVTAPLLYLCSETYLRIALVIFYQAVMQS